MSIFTIIAGVNGVGKSSLTGLLKGERSDLGIIVDVDAISAKCGGNIKGGKKAIQIINDCLDKKINFTQETTLSGKRIFSTLEKAKKNGYYIRMYYVALSSLNESCIRIENRVRKAVTIFRKKMLQSDLQNVLTMRSKFFRTAMRFIFMTMKTDLSTQANIKTVKL